jgi:hypothetical protein
MPRDSSKAAAIGLFCAGIDDYETAADLYDELGQSYGPIKPILEKYGATRWAELDALEDDDWWEYLEALAISIDEARGHFEPPHSKKLT